MTNQNLYENRTQIQNLGFSPEYTNLLRTIASLLVISCHCCHLGTRMDYSEYSRFLSFFMQSAGTVGVPVFFCLSGYYFVNTSKKTFSSFLSARIRTIVIPWIVTATVIYFYGIVRKGGFSAVGLVKQIFGWGGYTWYLSLMFIFFAISWKIRRNSKLTAIISVVCLVFGIARNIYISNIKIGSWVYFSYFVWFPCFSFGMLLANNSPLVSRICSIPKTYFYALLLTITLFFVIIAACGKMVTYWRWYYPILSLLVLLICAGLRPDSNRHTIYMLQSGFLNSLGRASFSIYLLHMPFAGIVAALSNNFTVTPVLIRPFLVFTATYIALTSCRNLAVKVNADKLYDLVTGYKSTE